MKSIRLCLGAVLVLACGCSAEGTSRTELAPPPAPEPVKAVARCGAGGNGFNVAGLTAVVAGTDNEFISASARQFARIKPGVKVSTSKDKDGAPAVAMMINNNSADFTCRCPTGCGGSCALELDANDPTYIACIGDCEDGDVCCSGCGLFKN